MQIITAKEACELIDEEWSPVIEDQTLPPEKRADAINKKQSAKNDVHRISAELRHVRSQQRLGTINIYFTLAIVVLVVTSVLSTLAVIYK